MTAQASDMPIQAPDMPAPLPGGATFQPQPQADTASASANPGWHNDAQADANELYAQPDNTAANMQAAQPLSTETPAPMTTGPDAVQADFQNANNLAAGNPLVAPQQPEPIAPMPTANEPQPANEPTTPQPTPSMPEQAPATDGGPQLTPAEPMQYEQPTAAAEQAPPHDPYAQNQQQPGLPGSESLGAAVAGMGQPIQPNQPAQQPMPSGSYGPPPKKGKSKLIFIILGVVIGLAAIGGGVYYFLSSRKTSTQTPSTNESTNTAPTPTPSSGPATPPTPPAGYVTITKQCYTFALYNPNTVPTDQSCSFANSTFGQKQISKISVSTGTLALKTLDEATDTFKPSVTVVSETKIKLDNFDAVQIVYKGTDGLTYSAVFTLIVGKNYQQDGQPVTSLQLTTSYQDNFDKEVTANVLDTWRWQ
jgi:hypothetical protein